jgi:hypothetical protein
MQTKLSLLTSAQDNASSRLELRLTSILHPFNFLTKITTDKKLNNLKTSILKQMDQVDQVKQAVLPTHHP